MFVVLGDQHASRIHHIICGPFGSIFPHYLINGAIFGEKVLNITCVFWYSLQLWSEIFVIRRRIERHVIKNVPRFSCRVPVIIVSCNEIGIFSTDFRKELKNQIFALPVPVASDLILHMLRRKVRVTSIVSSWHSECCRIRFMNRLTWSLLVTGCWVMFLLGCIFFWML